MTAVDQLTAAGWIERARSLEPVVRQHRDESEQQRRMAQAIFDAIRDAGFFEMLVPEALGGPNAAYEDYLRTVEEISRQDGSAGWNVMIWAAQGLFADYLPAETARELFRPNGGTLIAGAINPTGRARPEAEGYRVTGRWSFASGCQYATWLIASCVVSDGEAPHFLENGQPDLQAVLIPASECRIVDTWQSAGLRGTGSHDFEAEDVLVPRERAVPLHLFFTGPPAGSTPSYRISFYDLASPSIAAIALGIARDAIESFRSLAANKTPAVGTMGLSSLHTVHDRVGRAEALVRSARAYLYETVREAVASVADGQPVSEATRVALRLAAAQCPRSAIEAVDLVFDAAGGHSVYASSRLERCFRDVHMVTHHMMASPMNFEMVGQYLLGGPLLVRR